MMVLSLIVIAAQGTAAVLPYPGVVVTGEFRTSDGRSCSLAMWEGTAIDRRLLADAERKELDSLLKEIQQRWHDGDLRGVQVPLLRRYQDLTSPPGRTGSSPLALRTVTYQQVRVACGERVVRSGFALFPQAAGYALVAYHPLTNALLVLVDYAPKAKEVAEDLTAFLEAYRRDLEQASGEEELPRVVRDALVELKKRQQRGEKARIRFADVNGMYLPGCPGQCPPGTLADAWSRLAAEERRAFAPLLGLLARVGANPGELSARPAPILYGTETAWPEEFGDNPVAPLKGQLTRLTPGPLPRTFTRPDAAITRDLFGREDWEPPILEGQLKDVLKAMRKAVR